MMTKAKAAIPDNVTYVVKRSRGKTMEYQYVTVPSTWRVTYGGVFGKSNRGAAWNQPGAPVVGPNALRFWEGQMQRACIDGVESFMDIRIKLETAMPETASAALGVEPAL